LPVYYGAEGLLALAIAMVDPRGCQSDNRAMQIFIRRLIVPCSGEELYSWHAREGAFERLCAPWEQIRHVHADPLADDAKRIFEVKKGGLWMRWIADHQVVIPGRQFTDIQQQGPFKSWRHTHRCEAIDETSSRLIDHIEYEVPMGGLGQALAGGTIARDVDKMFTYRHRVTLGDIQAHARYREQGPLRVAISGASGLIGRQLVAFLRTGGHEVLRFVRGRDAPAADEIRWSVDGGVQDLERLEGLDAVIHLAGATVAQRWTDETRREILDSRVQGTRAIVEAIAKLDAKPRALLCASAVGYYGDTGAEIVDERAPLGEGFLAEVCQAWEAEARRAEEHCRTARLRIGVVLDPRGGALAKLLPIFRKGLGGRVGSGEQLLSWIGLDDVLGAFHQALFDDELDGALNLTGPQPVTQAELAKTLGRVLSRPAIAPAPAAAIKLLYGEMGQATVLGSVGARPERLQACGYPFRAPTLEQALRHCLGRGAESVSEPAKQGA
jgi:uncharacterized protein (TIGR01777 family)